MIQWFKRTYTASEKVIVMNCEIERILLSGLLKYVKNAIVYVDQNGTILELNQRAEELLNVGKKQALHNSIFKYVPKTEILKVIESKETMENAEIIINSRKCLSTRIPILEEEKVVGVLAIFDDITLFENINRAWEEEHSEKTLIKSILELAYDGILVVDKDGYITMISDAYKIFLGVENEDVVGKHCTEVIENTRMHIVAQTGIPEINDIQQLKNNYIVATRIPYYENGKLAGVIGKVLFRNMSELETVNKKVKIIEQELNSYKSELVHTHRTKYALDDIITDDYKMMKIKENVVKIAKSNSNVTIVGESGTGKELIAHAIHNNSQRRRSPFVKVNCAAIPEHLLEAELFGYEKGAFTGAETAKLGKFEVADGGTLFLDEIGDMSLPMQAKILRALQEGEVEKIGSNKTKQVDVRIVAATNRNLSEMIGEKLFRKDLFYRINVISISVPPLRERKEDILLIAEGYIHQMNQVGLKNVKSISNKAKNILKAYDWPGNVRELRNVMERAYHILEGDECIEPWHLPNHLTRNTQFSNTIPLKEAMAEFEKKIIMDCLISCKGNKTKASKELGISRMSLHKKLEKHNLKKRK